MFSKNGEISPNLVTPDLLIWTTMANTKHVICPISTKTILAHLCDGFPRERYFGFERRRDVQEVSDQGVDVVGRPRNKKDGLVR